MTARNALCQVVALSIAATGPAFGQAPATELDALRNRVASFLDAYERNDPTAVVALTDREQLDVYGSDVSEHAQGEEAFLEMMEADHALWSRAGQVNIGPMRDVSVRMSGDFATVFFDAPFRAGDNPELTVRFATVWTRKNGDWVLTQSANTVPTVGSSARELLNR